MASPRTERHVEIDPVWLAEWVAYGFRELDAYLTKHATFAAYCQRRDAQHRDAA